MIDKNSENDAKFMRLALKEAEKGIGLTSPNPTVGCVIVKKGKIVGYFRNGLEFGDRSLGSRSILADPTSHNVKNKINTTSFSIFL